ncbi:MAG TPA: PKD domain-containing protein, partial [Planctomycetota bacterium]|nr:PKD domain-containing protein [Planctomycetota bacterium]
DSVIEACIVYGVSNTCGAPGSATYAGAISTYYNSHNVTIRRNRVFDCLGNGIFVGSSGSTTAPNNNIVINNSVSNTPGLGSYPGGIAIRRSGGSTFSNNSVSMPANSTFGGFHLQGSSADPQPVEISNNIIRHEGSGPCFRFETTTIIPPATFDYNLYDVAGSGPMGSVAAVPTANLAAWQALLAPNMVGKELNSLEGPAGFTAPNDLHISPASLAFNSGSAVTLVTDDIDGQIRPLNGVPDRGCDETQGQGLFASFSAAVTSGPAPFTASFLDNSFTSDPGGILTWAWDFQNDGIVDSNQQSPSFNYLCPGTYSVSLTVTDAANPSSTFVRTSYIT